MIEKNDLLIFNYYTMKNSNSKLNEMNKAYICVCALCYPYYLFFHTYLHSYLNDKNQCGKKMKTNKS